MKELLCTICNKHYKTIQSLCNHNKRFHTNNINPCVTPVTHVTHVTHVTPIVIKSEPKNTTQYLCKYCNREFKRRQNKWVHESKHCKKTIEVINNPNKSTIINNKIVNNRITNNKITHNNNGTINNITINNYTNDNIDYISEAFIKRMFNHLKNKDEHHIPIPKVIENIKFNPSHKENNNVKITNMRSKVGLIYDDNKWLTIDKDELLNELYTIATDLLKKWSEKEGFLTEEMKEYYKHFNKISKLVLKAGIKENINKKAYIYTKNNDPSLDT